MNDRGKRSVAGARLDAPPPGSAEPDDLPDLVRRSLEGDDGAYAEIFRRFRGKVHRISVRFAPDPDDAMDLVQTVFIKAHRSLASYREEASFATWISRVATNCGIDHVRRRKREGKVALDESLEASESAAPGLVAGSHHRGPAATAENAELGRALRSAVDALSEKHRTVFLLHCVDGMPYQGIADTLRISIGTVMSRLFHARRYLRKSLAPYLGEAQVRTLLRGQDADAVQEAATPGGRAEHEGA